MARLPQHRDARPKVLAKAPFWVKVSASVASMTMLLAISSYNVVPTLKRAIDGDPAAIGLAFVQVAFTIFLAVIPFVPDWSAETRKYLTLIFMLGNGYFAFEIAGHRHDGERTAINQHDAIVAEQNAKKADLGKLGVFTHTDDYQVVYAQDAAKTADADKTTARAAVNDAKAKFAACVKGCAKLKQEAERLETEAGKKDADAKKAHDELQKLSGWATLTKQAAPIQARIDELQKTLNNEKFVADTSSNSETGRTFQALLIALLIELGNRYGPEAIYKFLRQLGRREDDEGKVEARAIAERPAAPVPSIVLAEVPQAPVAAPRHQEREPDELAPSIPLHAPATKQETAEAEPAAPMEPEVENEPQVDDPDAEVPIGDGRFVRRGFWIHDTQAPPKPPLPPTGSRRKPKAEPRLGNVISFAAAKTKKPTPDDVLAMIRAGRTQKQTAAACGIDVRTVKRYVAASKMSPSSRGQNEGTNQNG